MNKTNGISQNQLKIIAAVSMTIDHIGVMIFPQYEIFRIVGRIAFPIFAYMIYEGCKYTRNKPKYFIQLFALAVICVIGYLIYSQSFYANVLITFLFSVLIIFAIRALKKEISERKKSPLRILALSGMTVAVTVGGAWLAQVIGVDYGFSGVLLPVCAELLTVPPEFIPSGKSRLYGKWLPFIGFSAGLAALCVVLGGNQYYSLMSLPLLAAYNGERGKLKMKYFFYIFYPAHLAAIGLASFLING